MSLACRVHWSWVDRTGAGDTVKQSPRRVTRPQYPKCSDNIKNVAWLHQDVQEQASDFFFFVCFFSLSQLSEPGRLGTALSGPAGRRASAMTLSRCDTSPTVDCCSFQSVERRVQRNLEGLANVRFDPDELPGCRAATLTFFFFFLMLTRRRGLGERGDKILRWRHSTSNCTHYDACRRETAWVFPETFRSASRKTEQPFQAQSVSHRTGTDCQSRVEAYTTGFSQTSIFIPTLQRPHERRPMASRREQVSALFFRSLNTTSTHRMFSMGYRRAKSTQGNTNFQKRIVLANNFGITTRGP